MKLLVGTAGWSYADWVGPFYPRSLRHSPDAWLRHYGERFPTVEINSTYYSPPSPALVEGWIQKAAALQAAGHALEFSLKAPGEVTHRALPEGRLDDAVRALAAFERTVVDRLVAAGVLGCVLLQLPPFFRNDGPASIRALETMFAAVETHRRRHACEFRHRSWFGPGGLDAQARRLLGAYGVAAVATDAPDATGLAYRDAVLDAADFEALLEEPSRHAYVRLHGRNADVWFRRGAVESDPVDPRLNRYDYLYSEEELAPWAQRVEALSRERDEVRVYFNNHPAGKAPRNATDFLRLLGLPIPEAPHVLTEQRRLDVF